MDSKTYEYMNKRVEAYKKLQKSKKELEDKIIDLKNLGIRNITFRDANGSTYIPEPLREKVSKCIIQIFEIEIKDIEAAMESI